MTNMNFGPEEISQVPAGFRWGSAAAAIKYKDRLDVAIAFAENGGCSTAGVFTRNAFAAAPVAVCREVLSKTGGAIGGVITNSGCANAATGAEGHQNAEAMAAAARAAANPSADFLVCSTGTIGVQLPMDRLTSGINTAAAEAASSAEAFTNFADAILTTDTRRKTAHASCEIPGKTMRIIGCAKGAGMMQPDMATMLAYVFTDAIIEPGLLQDMFSLATEHSLNCVTVDGDTSTNDTAIMMASGASGAEVTLDNRATFEAALCQVLTSLAKQLARDGEGATKLIEVEVTGAPDYVSARSAAFKVANSPLVKTAIYGRDANWGRIAMALGNAGVGFSPDDVTIRLGELELFRKGTPQPLDEEAALKVLDREFIRIEAEIGLGLGAATVWTCDLTEQYIEINGSYRT